MEGDSGRGATILPITCKSLSEDQHIPIAGNNPKCVILDTDQYISTYNSQNIGTKWVTVICMLSKPEIFSSIQEI